MSEAARPAAAAADVHGTVVVYGVRRRLLPSAVLTADADDAFTSQF